MDDKRQLLVTLAMAGIFIGLIGLLFFALSYRSALAECYYWYRNRKMLFPDAHIADFANIMAHCYWGFWMYLAYLIGVAGNNYYSFYQPTKSIYVMKRIPNAGELHRRCLTVPLLGLAMGLVVMALCTLAFGLYYTLATPAEVSPAWNLPQIWRALL